MEQWRGMMGMLCAIGMIAISGAQAAEEPAEEQPIAAVQALLKQERLYAGPVDGVVGKTTVAAIRRYQILHGLRATGNLDSATLRMMLLPARPPSKEMTEDDRRLLRELAQTPIPEPVAEPRKPLPPAELPAVAPETKAKPEKKTGRSATGKNHRTRSHGLSAD